MRLRLNIGALVLALGSVSGCSRAPANPPARVGGPATLEWEHRLRRLEHFTPAGSKIQLAAFRARGAISAIVQRTPDRTYLLDLLDADYVPILDGPRYRLPVADSSAGSSSLTDVAGISGDGIGWFVSPRSGIVISQDISGRPNLVATLHPKATVRSACSMGDSAIAFVERNSPNSVFIRALKRSTPLRELVIDSVQQPVDGVRASDMRFGGGGDAACVLFSPNSPRVYLVSTDSVRALGSLVERATPRSSIEKWWRGLHGETDQLVVDATTFPGGVALLFGGATNGARRLIDLYSIDSGYVQTMILPTHALRVAASNQRIYALRQSGDSILLASYILPRRFRAARGNQADRPEAAPVKTSLPE